MNNISALVGSHASPSHEVGKFSQDQTLLLSDFTLDLRP